MFFILYFNLFNSIWKLKFHYMRPLEDILSIYNMYAKDIVYVYKYDTVVNDVLLSMYQHATLVNNILSKLIIIT